MRLKTFNFNVVARTQFLVFAFLFQTSVSAVAQDCDPKDFANITGKWNGPGKGSVRDIPKEDLSQQQAILQKLMSMVVDNYKPKGMNIGYGLAHYPPSIYKPNGLTLGNRYHAVFFLKYFYCNHENKVQQIAETHSIIEMRVNEWEYPNIFFVKEVIGDEDPETNVYGTISHKPVWNDSGYCTMTDTVYIAGDDITNFHHIVTKNRELPFVYMSKKEYLEKLRVYYEKQIQVTLNSWKNPTPDEAEYAKTRIDEDKSYYGKSIQSIDDFLVNSSEEVLNEAATVLGGGPPSEFTGFDENHRYSNWVIKPNPVYYNPKAPKHTPHFINVLFKIYEPEVSCMNAKSDILKITDFKMLQEIVDKGGVPLGTTNTTGSKPAGTPSTKK